MTQTAFHPGEHIQEELEALEISPAMLAEKLGIADESLKTLLAGAQPLSAEFALRLAHFFGTSAEYWMNLQSLFDLEIAQQKYESEISALPTLQAA